MLNISSFIGYLRIFFEVDNMKKLKLNLTIILCVLSIISIIQPTFAAYSVRPGASFRWDATYYFFDKDGGSGGSVLEYTLQYTLEFEFTNWGELSGMYYLNGTINNNGTIFDGEISHEYYYGAQPYGQEWVTEILSYQGTYPVHVYLACDTEIAQTTKPELQTKAANSWLIFGEPSTNNFTLTGTYTNGDVVNEYIGNIEFNSDKVLKHVHDEMVTKDTGVTEMIKRYIWDLTYTPGTGAPPGGVNGIPGFPTILIISCLMIGVITIIWKKKLFKLC